MSHSAFTIDEVQRASGLDARCWINGQWVLGQGTEDVFSTSPCQRWTLMEGRCASHSQVDAAVTVAREAFRPWRRMDVQQRLQIVRQFQSIVKENLDALALLIARETGKPLWESKTEAASVAGKVDLSIAALEERRSTIVEAGSGSQTVTRFKPHGVLAVLGPFNFPAHLPNGHIVPALLAGNCVVFKPSELAPLVGQWMATAWQKAGLPDGVLNLLPGGRQTGQSLMDHPEIDGLLFTGSSNAGTYFHKHFGPHPEKILALEMGGNNPLVVGPVEDLEACVYQIVASAFLTSGQRCTCARRLILIESSQTRELLDRLVERTRKARVGFFDDQPEPFMGTLISKSAGESLLDGWDLLRRQGGQALLSPEVQRDCTALLSPGIIAMPEAKTYEDREWFGPMLQVFQVPDLESAVALANQTRYGLSAGLLSSRAEDWQYFIEEIRAGVVNWNRQSTGASGKLPFGGCGLSGNHRPSGYYAADYCSFPVASLESNTMELPESKLTGLAWD